LLDDHTFGCEKLIAINQILKKDLMEAEIISAPVSTSKSKKKREQLKNMKKSTLFSSD